MVFNYMTKKASNKGESNSPATLQNMEERGRKKR